MSNSELPMPDDGIVLTVLLIVADVSQSVDFYTHVLGGELVMSGEPSMVKFHNSWIIINMGGGPTADKPDVTLAPPSELNRASMMMNLRVADLQSVYDEWRGKGAMFLTTPVEFESEIRCYLRDPDGYLIEVGQSKPR